ncbi:hypothetical protein Pyn_13003 [Prunus yedoensis var. nudiflora]|uniref:Uncharacterized protein n=1 Tax=Prunus yedoensis var. nudiflora TaxID=2094558 RepID=A0A314UYD6_PRUYE|nr:hypothetical protein Pyn_13003 [Prunus yedoensis var. nudiflora]
MRVSSVCTNWAEVGRWLGWSFWAGECAGGVNIGAVEVGAEAWGLGDGKRGAATTAMGARATDAKKKQPVQHA